MTDVTLKLTYPELSRLIQSEANKQNINVKGYDIKIDKLVINSVEGKLRVTGQIDSKWDAFFDFKAKPVFLRNENKLDLQDIDLHLDANNLIFKGILKLARGTIKSKIEKIIEKPLTEQIDGLRTTLDTELSKAPLPHNLQLQAVTKTLILHDLKALDPYFLVELKVEQQINISFQNIDEA